MPWPALVPLGHHQGKPPIPLMRPVMLIGSRHNAHLHLLSRQISKAHAVLLSSDGKVYIRDLASRTHVYVNGQEVREADLVDGDLLKIGSFTFRFQAAAGMKQKPAADSTPAGQLDVDGGEFPIQIDERVILVGRRPSCDISLTEESCSTAHAIIFSMGGKRYVRDLGSRTGTYVNGVPVPKQLEINFGDTVHIGDSDLRYQPSSAMLAAATSTADDLEDLVGTAPLLGEELELPPEEQLPPAAAAPAPVAASDAIPIATDDDLLKLDLDFEPQEEPPAAAAPAPAAEKPIPIAASRREPTPAAPPPPPAPPATLIGENLLREKLSSSATGINMDAEAIDLGEPVAAAPTPVEPESSKPYDEAPFPLADDLEPLSSEPAAEAPFSEDELLADLAPLPPAPPAPVEELKDNEWTPAPAVEEGPTAPAAAATEPIELDLEPLDFAPAEATSAEPPLPEPVAAEADAPIPLADFPEPLATEESKPAEAPAFDELEPLAADAEAAPATPTEASAVPPSPADELTFDELPELAPSNEPTASADVTFVPHLAVEDLASTNTDHLEPLPPIPEAPAAETPTELHPIEDLLAESSPAPEPVESAAETAETEAGTDVFFGDETVDEIVEPEAGADDDAFTLELPPFEPPHNAAAAPPAAVEEAPAPAPAAEPAPEPAAEPEAVDIIEPTEPTAASALPLADEGLEESAASAPAESAEEPFTVAEANLSDTSFGRQVEEFAAESPDPIVEEPTVEAPVIEHAPAEEPEPIAIEPEPVVAEPEPEPIAPPKIEVIEPQAVEPGPALALETVEVEPEPSPTDTLNLGDAEEIPEALEPAPAPASVIAQIASPADDLVAATVAMAEHPVEVVADEPEAFTPVLAEPSAEETLEVPAALAADTQPEPIEAPLDLELPELADANAAAAESAPFEEARDLQMAPEQPVTADPVPIDELPLEEPPLDALPDELPEAFEPVEATALPEVFAEPDVTSTVSDRPAAPLPMIPGMPLDLAQPAMMPEFVSGMPLVLNELPPPPPTFGRVQVSFNGVTGPQAIVDEPLTSLHDEPGPFDNLQIDIDNPVPGAPAALPLQEPYEEPYAVADEVEQSPTEAEPAPEIDELPEAVEEPQEHFEVAPPTPAPVPPPSPEKRGVFASGAMRLPPPPAIRRPRGSAPEQPPVEPPVDAGSFGGPTAADPGQAFGGLTAAFGAGNVDVFGQGLSADLSNDPVLGGAVKAPTPREPERKGGRRKGPVVPLSPEPIAADKPIKKSRRTLITPPADQVEEMAGRLADDLGAPPASELPPPPPSLLDDHAFDLPIESEEASAIDVRPPSRAAAAAVAPRMPQPVMPAAVPSRGHRGGGRVAVLLTVMVVLMVAAAWFIITFLKQQVHFAGSISYENFGKLTAAEQAKLQNTQKSLLVSEEARQVALNAFRRENPNVSGGFLESPEDFGRNEVRVRWEKGTLLYGFDGTDPTYDKARVKATLDAVYKLDDDMRHEANKTREQIENLRADLELKQQKLAELKAERDRAGDKADNPPAPDRIAALRADAEVAKKAFDEALTAAQQAGEALKQDEMKKITAGNGNTAGTAEPASAAANPAATSTGDAELDELTRSLDAMKDRLSTARNTVADQAEQARKVLDSAIEEMQRSTTQAEGMLKDNPELSRFVAEAQRTQQTVQKLAGDLLDRQQKSYEKLVEHKNFIEEHLAQHRKELYDSDKQIKRLQDDLAMRERMYNAAKDQGYDKEADQIRKDLEAGLANVEKRKAELESDSTLVMLNDLLARDQQDIAAATKQLEADRKQADALADQMQKSFAGLAPAVEKLPDSQRALAQQMTAKMEAVNSARKAAAEAIEAKNNDNNPVLKGLERDIQQLAARVEERRKSLEAVRSQQLPADQVERLAAQTERDRATYAAAVKTKAQAEQVYLEKRLAAEKAQAQLDDAGRGRADYEKVTTEYFNLRDKELPQLQQTLAQAQQNAVTLAYPSEPKLSEPVLMEDRRLPYTALAVAGIALVFSLMIFFTGSRGHAPHIAGDAQFGGQPPLPMATDVEPLSGYGIPRDPSASAAAAETAVA